MDAGTFWRCKLRTVADIIEHCKSVERDDFLGTMRSDLLCRIPFEDAKAFLKPDATGEDWKVLPLDRESIISEMKDYMAFALGKAAGHRGISADRSIDHYRIWTWLLGEHESIHWDNYQNYGMPILKQVCEKYGFAFPDDEDARLMSNGQRCTACCNGNSSECGR
jgi:hypothetical protein